MKTAKAMSRLYKLTDRDGYTRRGQPGETLWTPGCVVTATGKGSLCSAGVVHAYRYPELGLAMNPAHAAITAPRVWAVAGEVIADDGTKVGARSLRCLHELEVDHAAVTPAALVRWAIYLVRRNISPCAAWDAWSDGWLSGADRSETTAGAAAARAVEAAAAEAAAWATAAAAWAAARAVEAAKTAEAATETPAKWAAEAQALLLQAIGEESQSGRVPG